MKLDRQQVLIKCIPQSLCFHADLLTRVDNVYQYCWYSCFQGINTFVKTGVINRLSPHMNCLSML